MASGRIKRLVVSMPPRHGKSEFISKYFPAWFLGTFPDKRVILSSYEAGFASNWGRKARDLLEAFGRDVFGVGVRQDSSAADRWEIAGHLGGMATAGVGGPLTGKGADLLIVDDPIKNAEEAMSETIREKHKDWWRSTAYTRLEPGASAVVVCTRWNEDDLPGWLLSEMKAGGEYWEVLNLPALAEDGRHDPLGRKVGEALWPDRYPAVRLLEIKRTLGDYWFSAMYQGAPRPAEGNKFKRQWFRYWAREGDFYVLQPTEGNRKIVRQTDCRHFATLDLAFSLKTSADYSVIAVWAVTPAGDLLLIDLIRDRLAEPDLVQEARRVFHRFGLQYLVVESVGAQLGVVQALRRGSVASDGAHHYGLPVRAVSHHPDKVAWASTAVVVSEAGQLYFPERAAWLGEYEAELLSFPNAAHDDCVDVTSMACTDVFSLGGSGIDSDEMRAEKAREEEVSTALANERHMDIDNEYWWNQ